MKPLQILWTAAVLACGVYTAKAEESAPKPQAVENPEGGSASNAEHKGDGQKTDKLAFLRFATVVQTGEITEPGELLQLSRQFENWKLRCDVRLSTKRRVCFVEQDGQADGTGLVWRVATNRENRPIAMFSLPANVDITKGIRLKFADLEKVLEPNLFRCTAQACLGGFYFEGFVQAAIMRSGNVGFSIPLKDGSAAEIIMPMTGFTAALDAGGRDPFGNDFQTKAKTNKVAAGEAQPKKAKTFAAKPAKPAKSIRAPKADKTEQTASIAKNSGLF
ncbi:invasion associated locus B family protein [Brucella intermedia]|uniref:invasion associated locus B family protein n=1 Tax=Brucella intermedia TaxID=94625 RepID=UPI0023626896|nr:invasion associated locus B family protein [Brucella intermedia]